MAKKESKALLYIWIFSSVVNGQIILSERLDTNVTFDCQLRENATDKNTLVWYGPPYTADLGILYINTVDGVNPNTVLGGRLSVVGNHTAGEYNMKISNLQQSDEGKYICEYGHNRMHFNLQIKVPLTAVTINTQSVTIIAGRTSEVKCTTSDSVPAANVTWYILRQGSPTAQITSGITNTQENKKTISTLTYIGQKQENNGNLYCNATQATIQIKSQNVPISVLYKPSNIQISPVFDPYIVYVTQRGVQLQCSADVGNPPAITYTWSHNSVDTSNNPYVLTVTKNSGCNYACTAGNTVGTIATYKMITVQYGPEIQLFTKQQPVEGSRFVLTCYVSGKPAPTVQQMWWTRHNDNTFRQQGNQLVIDNIQKEQSGTYTCHAQNTLTPSGQSSINKTATQDVQVDILYKPVLTISPNFNPLILYVGQQNVQMTCSSHANPTSVEYWWTYNKRNYTGPVYNLQTVTKTSVGIYICNGRNTVGTNYSTVSVLVQYGPTIDPVSPQEFIAARYASVSCNVRSYPVANVTWTGANNFQQTGKTLIFNKTTKSHTGIYNCTATNTLTPSGLSVINKQQQIDVDVDILYKPEIMDIRISTIIEGENLTLTCSTRANPTAHNYKWTKIGDNTFQQLSKTLVITNIRRRQSGKYKCTAINTMSPTNGQTETGEGHGEVTVNVKYPPSIKTLDLVGSGIERTEGELISFKCEIDSYPNSIVTWIANTGNNRPVYTDYKNQISYYNFTTSCLDTGSYQCSAFNNIGDTATNKTSLFVKCSPRLDNRVKQKNINKVLLSMDDKIILSVQYLAYPAAKVTWSKFNYTSLTQKSIGSSIDGYSMKNLYFTYWQKSILTKETIKTEDFGTFIVNFDNGSTSSSTLFIVQTKGKPERPTDLDVVCFSNNAINVTWIPHFNGGYEQYFRIQLKSSKYVTFKNWTHLIPDFKKKTTAKTTVTGLTPNTGYIIRVVAINKIGESLSMEQVACNTKMPLVSSERPATVILGSILSVILVLVAFVFGLIFWRKRGARCKSQDYEETNVHNSHLNVYETLSANGRNTDRSVLNEDTGTHDIQLEITYMNTTLKTEQQE